MKTMANRRDGSGENGFALITVLLLLMLMSALAVGMVYLASSQTSVTGADGQTAVAYYGAEAGMEKMMSDLATLYQTEQAPTAQEITDLYKLSAPIKNTTFSEYKFNVPKDADGNPVSYTTVLGGSSAQSGLSAQVVPITLQVTADGPGGAEARMFRRAEVALIPVFQFGVYSDMDLAFHPGSNMGIAGRTHTNGRLFLAADDGNTLTFMDKITVVKDIVRDALPNGTTGYDGTVRAPMGPSGCGTDSTGSPGVPTSGRGGLPSCRNLSTSEGGQTNDWYQTKYDGYITVDSAALRLPFIKTDAEGNASGEPIEIVRRPSAEDSSNKLLAQSRLYNEASIRILLSDTDDGNADNVSLSAILTKLDTAVESPAAGKYFAAATNAAVFGRSSSLATDANWQTVPLNYTTRDASGKKIWPLLTGYLRIEYKDKDTKAWTGVTKEWLQRGFTRGNTIPDSEQSRTNTVDQNAIIILQQLAGDRNGNGTIDTNDGLNSSYAANFAYYPINFYDAREGESRDFSPGNENSGSYRTPATTDSPQTCSLNGIMNVVEIDVKNLKAWLSTTTGQKVEYRSQDGYILYFSDRRGLSDKVNTDGGYDYLDTVNASGSHWRVDPSNTLESYENVYPQNLNLAGAKTATGLTYADLMAYPAHIGDGFGKTVDAVQKVFTRINCFTGGGDGRANIVLGPRHALRLVNGAGNNLPVSPLGGGFTVASEQPVYVMGNYNSSASGKFGSTDTHVPAAVIADSVTLLSRSWLDQNSMQYAMDVSQRNGSESYWRMAIAGGKNKYHNNDSNGKNASGDWGSDGGVHNFLRYLENWGGDTVHYKGSLVSMYYSYYGTGTFKCCNGPVYRPPATRDYSFDVDFNDPSKMPPGTPRFLYLVNTGFRQDITPRH